MSADTGKDSDYTYRLEDGTVVSTTDRLCPGMIRVLPLPLAHYILTSSSHLPIIDVPPVAANIPTEEELFPTLGIPNVALLRSHFAREGKLLSDHLLRILERGTALLRQEPNLLVTDAPIISKNIEIRAPYMTNINR